MIASIITSKGIDINIREPIWGDQELLLKYHETLQAENAYVLVNSHEPMTLSEETHTLSYWLSSIHNHHELHYLLFDNSHLIGTCQLIRQGRRKSHVADFGISLLSTYRQQGIGYQVSRAIIEEARNLHIKLVTLDVYADNHPAIKLYRKLGFVEYGHLPGGLSYQNQLVDQVFMYKQLC